MSALLALREGNPTLSSGFSSQSPVIWKGSSCHDIIMGQKLNYLTFRDVIWDSYKEIYILTKFGIDKIDKIR